MKKYFKYTIILIITMIAFISKVNAGVSCTPSVTIQESSAASPAGFDVTLPVCGKEKYEGHTDIHSGESYPDEKAYAFEEVQAYYRNVDNKSTSVGSVPRCDVPQVYLEAVATYRIDALGYYTCPDDDYEAVQDPYVTTVTYDHRCYKDVKKDLCDGITDPAVCLRQNQGAPMTYCYWQNAQTPSSGNTGSNNSGSNNSGTIQKPGNPSPRPDGAGNAYNYSSNPSVQKVSTGSLAQSSGKCVRVNYYKYRKFSEPTGYTCPAGFEKVKGSSVADRKCEKIIVRHTGKECIKSGYHYTGNDGKNACSNVGKDTDRPIDRDARQILNLEVSDCTNFVKEVRERRDIFGVSTCKPVGVDYVLWCPRYSCERWDETFGACTPTFKADGNRAYCINPDQPYASSGKVDKTFDVTDCKSSFNTVDCGYSNILIEGNWCSENKGGVSEKAIEMAMRLWAVHTGQTGYSGPGLSLRRGSSCSQSVWYMSDGHSGNHGFYNVYEETYKYAKKSFFANASKKFKKGYLDPTDSSIYGDYGIACSSLDITYDKNGKIKNQKIHDKGKYGVACGGNRQYKTAITLLFSTILGNNKMEEHLYDLYDDTKTVEPTYAEFEAVQNSTTHKIVVRFDPVTYEKAFMYSEGDEVDCSKLKKGTKEYNALSPYCNVETELYDGNGNKLVGNKMQYCNKNASCETQVKLKGLLVCGPPDSKKPSKIRVKYKISPVRDSVVKYVSCSSPSSHQILYGFKKKSSSDKTTINVKTNVKEYEIVGIRCGNDFCDEVGLNKTYNKCKSNFSNYNGANTSSIKDPSLKCITHFRNLTRRGYYDFSDTFHVNTNLCRIYCSDEINYTIADKVKEKTGRNFKYDIPLTGTAFAGKKLEHPLSAIVEEKRTCVSKIYYNDLTESILQLREKYGFSQEELPSTYAIKCSDVKNYTNRGIKTYVIENSKGKCESARRPVNFVDLLQALVKKAKSENSRGENVQQIIYDLYNCNLYKSKNNSFGEAQANSDTVSNTTVLKKPQDNIYGNVRNRINEKYSAENNYGLDGCKVESKNGEITSNTCIVEDAIKYTFGSEVDGKKVEMGSIGTVSSSVGKMKYCSGGGCFEYKKNDSDAYKYGNGKTNNKVIKSSNSAILGKNFGLSNLGFNSINIPTNDYAYFEIKFAFGFYNKSRFVSVPMNGQVYYSKSSKLSKKIEYLPVEEYEFPTSTDAYNICSKVDIHRQSDQGNKNSIIYLVSGIKQSQVDEFNQTYTRCSIKQEFKTVATFFRKRLSNDDFVNEIGKNKSFSCYVDVAFPETVDESPGFDYRNADPENLFPYDSDEVKDKTTVMGDNWVTVEGQTAREYIENTSEALRTTKQLLDYTITLTPEQIENIKKHNSKPDTSDYINDPVDQESCKTMVDKYNKKGKIVEYGYYYDCKSKFLNDMRNDRAHTYGNIVTYKRDKTGN